MENPYTLEIIAEAPFISREEIQEKINRAEEAFLENRRNSLEARKEIVKRIVEDLRQNKEEMAVQITE